MENIVDETAGGTTPRKLDFYSCRQCMSSPLKHVTVQMSYKQLGVPHTLAVGEREPLGTGSMLRRTDGLPVPVPVPVGGVTQRVALEMGLELGVGGIVGASNSFAVSERM